LFRDFLVEQFLKLFIGEILMADIKNFGIRGIGADVQFGKSGGRVVYDSGNSLFKVTTDGTTLGNMNVATPTSDNHAANKSYVDSVAQGLDVKQSVRASSTANVTVASPAATLDGVTLVTGDRILLKDQTANAENGIYTYAVGGLTRATDMDGSDEFVGAFFFVEEGTTNSDQGYVVSTNGAITVGTTAIAFTQFTGTGQLTAGNGLSKSGNTFNVNVDDTFVEINSSDQLTVRGTSTTGEILKSNGANGVTYGALDLTNSSAVAGALPLVNGGLGVDASSSAGKTTARANLGLDSMAIQAASAVAITGGTIDISGGTITLANDQISGDKVSGGTIDSANLLGGSGKTISQYDITVGTGKTLDVDGIIDIDGAATSAMDGVAIGATTSAAGTFTSMSSDSVDVNGGSIDGTTIGASVKAAGSFTDVNASGTVSVNTIDNFSGTNIAVSAPMDVAGDVAVTGSLSTTVAIVSDTISERTGAAGVTVDGVLMKDGNVTGSVTGDITGDVTGDLTGNSAGVHTGNVSGNVTGNLTGAVTGNVTSTGTSTFATIDVNGGAIDGTIVGANASAAGTFTTMTTASAAITGGTISGTAIDLSGQTLTLTTDSVSGDSLHGGTYSDFASTGIDDNADQTVLTIGADESASFAGAVVVAGDLTVNGTLTSINTTNTAIADNTIVLNDGESAAGITAGSAGLSIDRGSLDSATLLFNETTDVFEMKVGSAYGDFKADAIEGTLTGNVTGDLTGNSAGIHTGSVVGTTVSASGGFTGDIAGDLTGASAGVHTGAVIGNVTGDLTGDVTGDLTGASAGIHTGAVIGDVTGNSAGTHTGAVVGTTVSASGGFSGALTGNVTGNTAGVHTGAVTGNLTGNSAGIHTGAVTGDVTGNLAGDVTSTGTSTFATVDVNGGAIDGAIVGANASAAGTFTTMTTASATITGGAISGATLNSASATITGGSIDGSAIGGSTSAAGTFSTLNTANATITGGTAILTSATIPAMSSNNVAITGGAISGTSIDLTGQTLTLGNDSVSGDTIHGGVISNASLAGTADTMTGYDITVGSGRTLDVSSGNLTLGANQISGDKIDGGTISAFASTGIDDNATSNKMTLSDSTATFGVAGDFGANTLAAGASTLASLNVTGNTVITGDLTVSGSVTTTLSEIVNIEDNIIVLNSNHTGAASQDAGISIERGTDDDAAINWNETSNGFELNVGASKADLTINDLTMNELTLAVDLAATMGGTGSDTSGFSANSMMLNSGSGTVTELAKGANSTVLKVGASGTLGYAKVDMTADVTGITPIANGGTGISASGSANKVMTSDGSALSMEYVGKLRNSTGVVGIDASGVSSGSGEYIALTNATGKMTMTAKNASGTGDVDLYLQGQGTGDVFIVGTSGEALIQGEDDTDLTVGGGDSGSSAAGDLILKGGNGSASGVSGAVIIKGGNGGATDGNVQIKGADDTAIATFVETASATDSLQVTNGIGGVELAMLGGTNVNMTLAPKGSGIILAPAGYDMSSAADAALATKEYVDDQSATSGSSGTRRVSFTANGSSSFTVGTMANTAGKSYYVSRVLVKVTTAFGGADELVVSDGTNTLMATTDGDLSETGLYIVEQGFENATSGGATITGTIQNGGASASPSTGACIVTVEYKQI